VEDAVEKVSRLQGKRGLGDSAGLAH
jgi:hypothetical protein